MKIKFIIILTIILGYSLQNKAQNEQGYILDCQFKGLPDGTKAYLRTKEKDTVAKAISNGERIVFRGKLPLNGRFHFIHFDTLVSKVFTKAIFLINKSITVSGKLGTREVIVTGSPAHNDYSHLIKALAVLDKERKMNESLLSKNLKQGGNNIDFQQKKNNELKKTIENNMMTQKQTIEQWIEEHPVSLYAPYVIKQHNLGFALKQLAYDRLSIEARTSYYGVELKKQLNIERQKSMVKIIEKEIIPDLSIIDTAGKLHSILNLAAHNKYTLIDVWASWCKPCRAEVPVLKKLYNQFKDKGLNIIGISSDSSEGAWKKAIKEDGTNWTHCIQDKEKTTTKLFDLKAIPAYILIDSNGKMIAFDCAMSSIKSFGGSLRGEALEKKIEELLGK